MNLRLLLHQQGLSVRQLALELEVPLKTVQDWVYRGVVPSPANQKKLDQVVACTHHWIIETPEGPVSEGRCRICGEEREFANSAGFMVTNWNSDPAISSSTSAREADDDE